MLHTPVGSTLSPYTTLFRSRPPQHSCGYVSCPWRRIASSTALDNVRRVSRIGGPEFVGQILLRAVRKNRDDEDRKSTRLNSSHANISYAVFCLKKKKIYITH